MGEPMLTPMGERYTRPDWVRRLNAMGDATGGAGRMVPIGADELLERATESMGTDAFGDLGDGDWETRFRQLVDAVNASDFHTVGRMMTREELLRCLRTRLAMAEQRRRHPEIGGEAIAEPVVITGPARSGTSILFELLALDPGLVAPRAADALHPVPSDGVNDEELLAMAECEQELWADVQPEFAAIHELRSDLPVECVTLTAPSFAGPHWVMVMQEGEAWFPDPGPDYAFHRSILQSLQFGRPTQTWVLKTPGHLITLDALFEAYPDARVVLTHRDPARTMPSTVSTAAMMQWMRTDEVALDPLAEAVNAAFSASLTDVARRRTDGSFDRRFGDVRFTDLMTDPVAAISTTYEQIGRSLDPSHAEAIGGYLRDKPKGKFGVHRYTASEWGFDAAELHQAMAEYMDAFDVPVE
jgi:hypothetical protein